MKYMVMAIAVLFCISICGCLEGIETPPWSKDRIEKLKAIETETVPFLVLPI